MEFKYCVVVCHNFDADTPVYLFDTYEKAVEYLQDFWQEYYNEEIANESEIDESLTFHEDEYAQVTWMDGCYTEFILTATSEPMKINGKSYK